MQLTHLPGGKLLGWCRLEGLSGHDAGRQLLAALYREKTGCDLPAIRITEYKKPYFPDSPLHFSISHTRRHAFCVLSQENIGMDAEESDRPIRLELAGKILSASERAEFDRAEDKRQALLKLWVLKEAAAKLGGRGLQGYPTHTSFSLDDPRVTQIDGCYVAIVEGE